MLFFPGCQFAVLNKLLEHWSLKIVVIAAEFEKPKWFHLIAFVFPYVKSIVCLWYTVKSPCTLSHLKLSLISKEVGSTSVCWWGECFDGMWNHSYMDSPLVLSYLWLTAPSQFWETRLVNVIQLIFCTPGANSARIVPPPPVFGRVHLMNELRVQQTTHTYRVPTSSVCWILP